MANSFVNIKIGGALLDETTLGALDSVIVDNAINLPDSFTAAFVDPEGKVLQSLSSRLGSPVEIAVSHEGSSEPETIMKGEVTSIEVDYDAAHSGKGTRTLMRGLDASYRLQHGRKTRSWQQVTAHEVAQSVAQDAGLKIGQMDATDTTYDHVVQSNLGDLEFLRTLAAENDREAIVSDAEFHFRKKTDTSAAPGEGNVNGNDPFQLVLHGGNLLSLHATVRITGQVKEVEVRGWSPKEKNVVRATASASTTSASAGTDPVTVATAAGGRSYVSVSTPFGQSSETQSAAQALADGLASSFAEIEGSVNGEPRLKAGVAVSLGNVGKPIDGKYVVSSTTHRVDDRGYETSFFISGQQDRSMLGLIAGGIAAETSRIAGVVPGLVENVDDPEKLGRVKVKFPWLDDSYVSDWVRMTQFGAGPDRGALFLPEVDDEVLVAFEQGDMRRPYVVGSLYNGIDKPKVDERVIERGVVKRRGYVSKKGSMLVFFDDDNSDGVAMLTSDKGLKLSLNKTKTTIHIASNGEIKIEGNNKVTIDGGQELVLLGQKVTVGSDSTQEVDVKGLSLKLEARQQASVSAPQISLG